MNIVEVQAVFERVEPIVKKSNNRLWIAISVVGIVALVAIIIVSHSESKRVSVEGEHL